MAGHGARRPRITISVLAMAALLSAASASALTLHATAGLSGVARAGRWTPVRITIAAPVGESFAGDLVLEWGDARLTHRVAVEGGARRDLELYVRSSDPRRTIAVRLVDRGGRELARTEAQVELNSYDRDLVVCVAAAEDTACSIAIDPALLPREMRGYDAADRVVIASATHLSEVQSRALLQWRGLKSLEQSGVLAVVPQIPSTVPGASARRQTGRAEAAALALILVALAATVTLRSRPLILCVSVLTITAVASLSASRVGRVGPGSDVAVHHTSVLVQLPDQTTATLTSRAVAIFPAFDDYRLKAAGIWASMQRRVGRMGIRDEWIAEDGHTALAGSFAAGTRQPVTIEALVDIAPIRLAMNAGVATAVNTSSVVLEDCRWLDGAVDTSVAIPAGGVVSLPHPPGSLVPVLRCTMEALPLSLVDDTHGVRARGTTQVLAMLPAGGQ